MGYKEPKVTEVPEIPEMEFENPLEATEKAEAKVEVEEAQEPKKKEEGTPQKEVTINDVVLDHERRLLRIEAQLYRLGGI